MTDQDHEEDTPETRRARLILSLRSQGVSDPAVLTALKGRGHIVTPTRPGTSANSIEATADGYVGAADPRTRGSLAAGY